MEGSFVFGRVVLVCISEEMCGARNKRIFFFHFQVYITLHYSHTILHFIAWWRRNFKEWKKSFWSVLLTFNEILSSFNWVFYEIPHVPTRGQWKPNSQQTTHHTSLHQRIEKLQLSVLLTWVSIQNNSLKKLDKSL